MAKRTSGAHADDISPKTDTTRRRRAAVDKTEEAGASGQQAARIGFDGAGFGTTDESGSAWEPREEDIRVRAYHRFLDRGRSHGMDFDDWLEAERELKGPR